MKIITKTLCLNYFIQLFYCSLYQLLRFLFCRWYLWMQFVNLYRVHFTHIISFIQLILQWTWWYEKKVFFTSDNSGDQDGDGVKRGEEECEKRKKSKRRRRMRRRKTWLATAWKLMGASRDRKRGKLMEETQKERGGAEEGVRWL